MLDVQTANLEAIDSERALQLSVQDVRKSFSSAAGERIEVLRGVSFAAVTGQSIAVVGPSGAGKSTLLHLIGGIENADHGTIEMGEFSVRAATRSQLARYRNEQVGFVFQFHHLLPDLTATENVALPLRLAGKNRREANIQAQAALERVELGQRASHKTTELSGGEQQRVAVCRALINRPVLLLTDEPTGNLDTHTAQIISSAILSYAAGRPAIVIVATHNQSLAQRCDRMLTLEDGKLSEPTRVAVANRLTIQPAN